MAMCKLPDHNLKARGDFNHLNSLFYRKKQKQPMEVERTWSE